ncbi:MAG TPA: ATP-binding cassette domain-containing protein [Chthoniobacterales bacterium]|jgi:ABC-2 type transport system ATP-binding protein|nr:ATP-binding cassette domain-containing protein [Chthoniobacterales bacterium]
MIKVEQLTKKYAGVTGIDQISFEVGKGEIVGFLGPNGAGKTTTMRILASYMPASSGRATVAGFDVFSESLQARRHLGYLPENVPLYHDMRVNEYLRYRGALKALSGKGLKNRIGTIKELCGLREVGRKKIAGLSKGFRQRVGLAEAMIHEPDLLILDEPTIGLDPNQIRQVRELIKSLGQRHTILLSTHILSEVEATCSRVIIINRGRIEASDTPENLVNQLRTSGLLRLEVKCGVEDPVSDLSAVPGVREVRAVSDGEWRSFEIRVEAKSDPREQIFQLAVGRQWVIRELSKERATLEDAFVELTHTDG